MKVTSTGSAVRAAMSPAEIDDLISVIRAADRAGHYIPDRVTNLLAGLSAAAAAVRARQTAKRAERDYARFIEQARRARERYFMIGEAYSVTAHRADYADISSNPDWRHWVDLVLQEVMSKPIPAQCEIRRDVWLVRVVRLRRDAFSDICGSDCTETADFAAVEGVAQRLIAQFEARERPAA